MADALWRECANWLAKCKVIADDHRVTCPSAQVLDLANTLRDGVLLCQLVNALNANSIDMKEVSLRPQMSQFLCLKNIRTFLSACQTGFGLESSLLFEPYMLFDLTDFGQVLNTLSLLSRSQVCTGLGIESFPLDGDASLHYYDNDVYRNLDELEAIAAANNGQLDNNNAEDVVNSNCENEEAMVAFEFPAVRSSSRRTHEEDIYEDLCYVTLRVGPSLPQTSAWPAPAEKRDFCIKELVETENNYVEALNMMVRHFLRPLKNIMTQEDRHVIFVYIKELTQIHTGFHSELYKACSSSQCRISVVFLNWKDKFVIYGNYCANLTRAQDHIDQLCHRNELVNQAVIRCQMEANDGKFKLRDLLSLPMQRILKYHLLLNELIKCTTESHIDYEGLKRAHESMLDLGQYINEVKRDSETLQIIRDIQQSITDLDMPENTELKDYGRLVMDGELRMKSHDDTKQKNRYIFVFDRVMLMCKSIRGEQYSYKEALVLEDYRIEDVPSINFSSASKLIHKDKFTYSWLLVHRQDKITYTFYAKTEDIKRKWIDAIKKAFETVCLEGINSSDHSFVMQTFDKPTTCSDCEKLLRGIFFQGYKCSTCGFAVHRNCIATVRSCGAPNLPPRPPFPSSPSIVSVYSGDGDESFHRLSWGELNRGFSRYGSPFEHKLRALFPFDGDRTVGQVSFVANDIILLLRKDLEQNRSSVGDQEAIWWHGKVLRTEEEGSFPSSLVEDFEPKRASYEDTSFSFNGHSQSDNNLNKFDSYVNLQLEECPWFAGPMEREAAQAILERLPSGTYLVRISPKQRGNFAISLNYNGHVKHIRVCIVGDSYYLSTTKYFRSILELIKWYEEHNLSESFNGLNLTLCCPYKQALSLGQPLGQAVVLYSYPGNAANVLSLVKGERVTILSKTGEERGWWKGQIEQRIGYFPLTYVKELPASGSDLAESDLEVLANDSEVDNNAQDVVANDTNSIVL
ncbi:Guanine nucleotide exchange factor VAV2 [Halotydeus destructor]|nr:Guanine nucleotide exchange factor VAV2 [Halotydeus destructor]